MRFSEWLRLDEARFKGLWRQWKQAHPNVPDYILHQMFINHVGPEMGRQVRPWLNRTPQTSGPIQTPVNTPPAGNNADPMATAAHVPAPDPDATASMLPIVGNVRARGTDGASMTTKPSINTPSSVIKGVRHIDGVQWKKTPQVVSVTPISFESASLHRFRMAKFGFQKLDNMVRNDRARTTAQTDLAAKRGQGENEPIMLVMNGRQWELLEGYHRTMSYLLSLLDPKKGCPPDQQELIRSGQLDQLDFRQWTPDPNGGWVGCPPDQLEAVRAGQWGRVDFSSWVPVMIKAYVGTRGNDVRFTEPQQNNRVGVNQPTIGNFGSNPAT